MDFEIIELRLSVLDPRNREFIRQMISFGGVGVMAGVIDYTTMVLLREFNHLDPVLAALAGYFVGGLVSYTLNRISTFSTARPHTQAIWRFAVSNAIGFFLTGLTMYLQVNVLHASYLLAKIISIFMTAISNFVLYKYWAFSPK